MAYEFNLSDLKGILRRRKKVLLIPFALIALIGLIVAFALPPIYRAQVMIFIENQEIPREFVQSTTAAYASERLHNLEQQILSYPRLLEIIQNYDLYPELPSYARMVNQMRQSISIVTLDVPIRERGSVGRAGALSTVAFTLSYEHKDPKKAADVANLLANFYVQEDRQSRGSRAETTTEFLSKELEDLRRQVRENEERVSRFRASNIDQLPGSTGTFQQMVFRLEQDIERIDARRRTLQEKNIYLTSQISNIDPLVPILTDRGKVAANPANRLKFLRLQLIQLQSSLSDRHPDIIRLKNEIADLEAQVGDEDTSMEKENRLTILEKEMAEAKSKYGDRHPDVIRLSREADLLRGQLAQQKLAPLSRQLPEERSDNPEYMNLRAQIIVTESEIDALRQDRIRATQRLEDYQRRLEMAPFIDEQFNALTLDYENAKKKFDEVSQKLHAARIAQEMDLAERGERFRINHPAYIPNKPFKPNRLLIVLIGFVLGAGTAVVLAAAAEGLDSSIKTPDEMESVLGVPLLATISLYDSPREKRLRRFRRAAMTVSVVVLLLLGSVIVDRFVIPLDELWTTFEDRLVEMGVPIVRNSVES
jgi:polysaccharide biosynthesis transport protein